MLNPPTLTLTFIHLHNALKEHNLDMFCPLPYHSGTNDTLFFVSRNRYKYLLPHPLPTPPHPLYNQYIHESKNKTVIDEIFCCKIQITSNVEENIGLGFRNICSFTVSQVFKMVLKGICLLFIVAVSTYRSQIRILLLLLFAAATVAVVTNLAVVSVDDLDFVATVAVAAAAAIM